MGEGTVHCPSHSHTLLPFGHSTPVMAVSIHGRGHIVPTSCPNNVEAGHENCPNPMRKKTMERIPLHLEVPTSASRLGVSVIKSFSSRGLPLTRGSAPGPRWRLCPQILVIGSALAIVVHRTFLYLKTPLILACTRVELAVDTVASLTVMYNMQLGHPQPQHDSGCLRKTQVMIGVIFIHQ